MDFHYRMLMRVIRSLTVKSLPVDYCNSQIFKQGISILDFRCKQGIIVQLYNIQSLRCHNEIEVLQAICR